MGYWMGPTAGLDPQTQFLSVCFGRPFIILTKLRIHVVAGNNTIRLDITCSLNMVSNTLPPVLGLYFSRYEIGHVCHNTTNQYRDFIKYDTVTTGLWTRYWTAVLNKDRDTSLPTRFKPSLLSNQVLLNWRQELFPNA